LSEFPPRECRQIRCGLHVDKTIFQEKSVENTKGRKKKTMMKFQCREYPCKNIKTSLTSEVISIDQTREKMEESWEN
jgi:hypothetical protein